MADCGCTAAREGMEDFLHNEVDDVKRVDISDHLSDCTNCEDEWRVGQALTNSVKRACCEEAPQELKATIQSALRDGR